MKKKRIKTRQPKALPRRVKTRRKQGADTERELVRKLIKEIEKHPVPVKVIVDSDSPGRAFKSGFDFLLTRGGKVVFVEAKRPPKRKKERTALESWGLLSPFQKLMATELLAVGSPFFLLVFEILPGYLKISVYSLINNRDGPWTCIEIGGEPIGSIQQAAEYLVRLFDA